MPCRQGRGKVEFRFSESRDWTLKFSHANLVIGGPGLLDEKGREFKRIGALWGFVKALLQVHAVGSCCLPV